MSERIFLDTNIVLDYVFERNPFFDDASALFQLKIDEEVEFFVSALTLANLAYSAQREKKNPRQVITVLLEWIDIIPLDREVFRQTLPSAFMDFEDGLQYFSAATVKKNIDAIITRNKKDFAPAQIPVYTASEYLVYFKNKH